MSEDKDHIRWPKSSAPLCLTKIEPPGQEALRYQTHGTRAVPDVSVFSRTRLRAGTASPFLVSRSDHSATCHGYTKPCSVLLSCVGEKKDKNVDLGEWRNTGCKEAVLFAGFGLGGVTKQGARLWCAGEEGLVVAEEARVREGQETQIRVRFGVSLPKQQLGSQTHVVMPQQKAAATGTGKGADGRRQKSKILAELNQKSTTRWASKAEECFRI